MAETTDSESDKSLASSKALITTEQLAIQNLTARISQIEKQSLAFGSQIRRVRTEINGVVLGVVLIFLFTMGAVAVEVTLFHTRQDRGLTDFQMEYYRDISALKESQKSLESLTIRLRDSLAMNKRVRCKLAQDLEALKEKVKQLSMKR